MEEFREGTRQFALRALAILKCDVWPSAISHARQDKPTHRAQSLMSTRHREFTVNELLSLSPPLAEDASQIHNNKMSCTVKTKRQRPEVAISATPFFSKSGPETKRAVRDSPSSILYNLFAPSSPTIPSNGWSKICSLLFTAYTKMVTIGGFFDDGAPIILGSDRWGVVHGAQAMAYAARILTTEQLHSTSSELFSELTYDQRVRLSACLCLSMKFQRQAGMVPHVTITRPEQVFGLPIHMSAEVGLAYSCFLLPKEQLQFHRTIFSWETEHKIIQDEISAHQLELVSSVDRSFEIMGRNMLCAVEEAMWAAMHTGKHPLLQTQADVFSVISTASFLADSAARAFPGLVFDTLQPAAAAQRASGLVVAALAVCSGSYGIEMALDPIISRANETALVRSAVDFLQAALSVPAADARRGAGNDTFHFLSPASLHATLCKLEAYSARESDDEPVMIDDAKIPLSVWFADLPIAF